jgi:hypothetical protein
MTFKEAEDFYALYSIDPELTCSCDELHICQQCYELECQLNSFEANLGNNE